MQDSSLLKNMITKKPIKCVHQENTISQFPYYLQIIKEIVNLYQLTLTLVTLILYQIQTKPIIFVYRCVNRIEN